MRKRRTLARTQKTRLRMSFLLKSSEQQERRMRQ
jgi:hypothetical protein